MNDDTFSNTSVVCRLEEADDAIIRAVADLPKAEELRTSQGLGDLLSGGWMEDALAFTEGDDDGERAVNVLIIPEDFGKDQYILKPIFERLFRSIGRCSAKIEVCQEPLLGGVDEALKSDRISEIVGFYPMTDIFILCVDRDGKEGRRNRLDEIEAEFSVTDLFLAANAWEEIETWVLAGVDLPKRMDLDECPR